MIAVVDVGNACAVLRAMPDAILATDRILLDDATRIVVPGMSRFDVTIDALEERDMCGAISAAARRGVPILGICSGAHVLCRVGYEGGAARGLELLDAEVVSLRGLCGVRTRIGWVRVPRLAAAPLWFAHSYAMTGCPDVVAGSGAADAARTGTTTGVQFHPELSGRVGYALLQRFAETGAMW